MADTLISVGKAARILGITPLTLKKYPVTRIQPVYTDGGHRRYRLSDIEKMAGVYEEDQSSNKVCCYVRVSSQDQKQKGDLERQKARVLQYAIDKQYQVGYVFEEVGSGLNDRRSKLNQIISLVNSRNISKVVIENKDRLTRFNFNIYKEYFASHGVDIEVTKAEVGKSFEEELVQDMISIMSSFSAKVYGKRGHQNKKDENSKSK